MCVRNVWRILLVMGFLPLLAVPAAAGVNDGPVGGGQGVCDLDGAWFGVMPSWGLTWTAVYDSDSHWAGTLSVRLIGGDPTLGGAFPDAESLSGSTGTWVRTGRSTFDYTMIHYALAAGGQQPVSLLKNSGSVVVTGGCDRLEPRKRATRRFTPSSETSFGAGR